MTAQPEFPVPPGTARFEVLACDVQPGDYIIEVFSHVAGGVAFKTHCHGKRCEGRVVYVEDCDGDDHLYRAGQLLVVWRPQEGEG